jgi:Protein of unknown function (DUF3485)
MILWRGSESTSGPDPCLTGAPAARVSRSDTPAESSPDLSRPLFRSAPVYFMSRPDRFPSFTQNASPARSVASLSARAALACALVLASGAVRWWQVRRIDASMDAGLHDRQFKLAEIPLTLGHWTGVKTEIDARIVASTGSHDLITRHYTDADTGVGVDVIILFGPSSDIFIHTPELCYPKAGFISHAEAVDRTLDCDGVKAGLRSVAYTKGDAGSREIQDVYFTWRYNGQWTPKVGSPKQLERIPGMYKIQVARQLKPRESHADDRDPCESFLKVLIPDLESRITGEAPAPKAPAPKP